jgi:hypothetical protein
MIGLPVLAMFCLTAIMSAFGQEVTPESSKKSFDAPRSERASQAIAGTSQARWTLAPRRLIATGWDTPTPARFRAELAEFERWGAFAGTTIAPTRRLPDGTQRDCRNAFSRERWERDQFNETLADLKAVRPVLATENFLMVWANPGDVDWFDDQGWSQIVDHWRHLAWLATQGGLRGLCCDAEPYTKPHQQFNYTTQPERDRHSFEEYRAKARQRGREVMQAVAAEFPDVTILTYRLLCDLLSYASLDDPAQAMEGHTYGLQPAFIDGWLDAAPPTVTIVEGNENAYLYSQPEQFDRAFVQLRVEAPRLLAPEHQAKVRAQYRVGHGLYLDAHANPPGSKWHVPPLNGSGAARLEANVTAAFRASDGYVWLWGEKGRWWPGGRKESPLWPERLPGADGALLRAARPEAGARAILAAASSSDNLLSNPGFDATGADGIPAQWWTWQHEASKGRVTTRDGAACLQAMANGCLAQTVAVKPGERYAVSARVRQNGRGSASVTVRWKTADDRWTAQELDRRLGPAHRDGWRELATVVLVPDGVGHLVLLLGASHQAGDADYVLFDDVWLVRIVE